MTELNSPISMPDISITPPLAGRQPFDADLKRTLAMLMGKCDSDMRLLRCSPSGVLTVSSNTLEDIFHVTATSAGFEYQGDDIPCSEVMIMAHPDNTGRVWVRRDTTAAVTNAWPLEKKESITITLSNLSQLRLLIANINEIAIIAHTR